MCMTAPGIMEVGELVVCDSLWSRYLHLNHIFEDGGSSHWPISVQLDINSHFNIIGLLKVILTIVTFACREIVVVDLTCAHS